MTSALQDIFCRTLSFYASLGDNTFGKTLRNMEKYVGFIPIENTLCISPINNSTYYTSNNVHPTQEGYDRVAEILSESVY